jgi:inositol phosphorylceramide synthase catalytic subunit
MWRRRLPSGASAWWAWASLGVIPLLMLGVQATRGLRGEHYLLAFAFLTLAWVGPRGRRFSFLALPFVLVGLGYEQLRFLEPLRGRVHVDDLYQLEGALFRIGGRPLSEIIASHTHPLADVITGFAYFTYMFESFVFAAFFYLKKDEPRMARIAWGFFAANLIGWAIWLAFPAAPPWYVDVYGLGPAHADAIPSAAGALRVDALFGIHLFQGMYSRNTNVFGAMPSLHVAYPTVVALVVSDLGRRYRVPTIGFALLVGFSAVYLRHHYILDVLAGTAVAFVSYALVRLAEAQIALRPAPQTATGSVTWTS